MQLRCLCCNAADVVVCVIAGCAICCVVSVVIDIIQIFNWLTSSMALALVVLLSTWLILDLVAVSVSRCNGFGHVVIVGRSQDRLWVGFLVLWYSLGL